MSTIPEYAKTIETTTLYRSLGPQLQVVCSRVPRRAGDPHGVVRLEQLLGAFGFVVMLVSAIVFTQNLRKMGRAGWQQMTEPMRSHSVNDVLGDTRQRLRERFKRED